MSELTDDTFGDAELLDSTCSDSDYVDPEVAANLVAVATYKAEQAGF